MQKRIIQYYPSAWQAVHLLVLYMFIQAVVDFPLALIDYFNGTDYLFMPVKKVILNIGSVAFILIYGVKRSRASIRSIFPLRSFNLLIIIPVTLFLIGAHNILEQINLFINQIIPAPDWFWELFSKMFDTQYGWTGTIIKVAVVAPIVEELIFRGIILHGLRKNYSKITAIVVSALLFSLFHLNPWQMPATFILGLLLGWLVIVTDSIIPAIVGHSINNGLVLLTMKYWSSLNENAFFIMDIYKKLSLSTLLIIFSIFLILLLTRKTKKVKMQ